MADNIYILPENTSKDFEIFQSLYSNENVTIERIFSNGQKTPDNQWLEQDKDEWVILIQGEAELRFENEYKVFLNKGDYLFIPKNTKHRVEMTGTDPSCIWLAFHF